MPAEMHSTASRAVLFPVLTASNPVFSCHPAPPGNKRKLAGILLGMRLPPLQLGFNLNLGLSVLEDIGFEPTTC